MFSQRLSDNRHMCDHHKQSHMHACEIITFISRGKITKTLHLIYNKIKFFEWIFMQTEWTKVQDTERFLR